MGKKSSQSPMKISKNEKKQNLNSLIKILRPKVYITDSSNFKNLVQELTGNGKYSPVSSSPPSSISASLSPPICEAPFLESSADRDHMYRKNYSLDSSCFSSPMEGSPDLSPPGSLNYTLESNSLTSQKIEFSLDYKELESMLTEMDWSYDACYGMLEQEVCVYDYDFSGLI